MGVLGLPKEKIKASLNREYSIPLLFEGSKSDKIDLFKSVNDIGLSLQEGGRVINLSDKVSKSQAMKNVVKVFKKVTKERIFTCLLYTSPSPRDS